MNIQIHNQKMNDIHVSETGKQLAVVKKATSKEVVLCE